VAIISVSQGAIIMPSPTERDDAIKKLGSLIKDIQFAMLTTAEADGSLRSRPMATQKTEFDGCLWFFTRADSPKVSEISEKRQVNLSYANPNKQNYVSISGTATLVRDPVKNKELWNPLYKAWFPDGLDDPQLALLKVDVEKAEYWDSPSSSVVHILGFLKTAITGQPAKGGEHEKISIP
jgi:general stress protein 26